MVQVIELLSRYHKARFVGESVEFELEGPNLWVFELWVWRVAVRLFRFFEVLAEDAEDFFFDFEELLCVAVAAGEVAFFDCCPFFAEDFEASDFFFLAAL